MNAAIVSNSTKALLAAILLYPQAACAEELNPTTSEQSASEVERDPGCDVPRGYDCATPGFEAPLTLEEAEELSRTETVVYLYGPGIQGTRLVARIVRSGENAPPIPAIAVPGADVPEGVFHVVILGRVIKHRESGEPVEFYQGFINRGELFALTRTMHQRIVEDPS